MPLVEALVADEAFPKLRSNNASTEVSSTNQTPLLHAGRRLSDRILRDRPARTNYRYELGLEAALSFAEATGDGDAVNEVFAIARALGVAPEANVSWRAQPFGCLTWALYEASDDERWLEAFRNQTHDLLQNVWRGPDGELLHPRGQSRGGGYAMLIDAMQEYVARMARMAVVTSQDRALYLNEIVKQCEYYRATLRYRQSGLWSQGRGWLKVSPAQLSPGAWSRGHGWLLQGFSRALEVLPENTQAREVVQSNFRELCTRLLPLQQPDGSWHTMLSRDPAESPVDISGTAMIATAMSKGIRKGWLQNPEYAVAAEKSFALLPKYVTAEGKVLSVSPGPGPLQSEEDYLTNDFPEDNDHGIFAVLFAAAEQRRR
jgi:rhamnogalacturonyl hydrolase YesR